MLRNYLRCGSFAPTAALGLIAAAPALGQTFVGLGVLPGATGDSTAKGVSGDGSVVTGTSASPSYSSEAFRWTNATGMVGLGVLAGTLGPSSGWAVSGDGAVVTGYAIESSNGPWVGIRWTSAAGMQSLGSLGGSQPGGQFRSWGLGLSADGSVATGWSFTFPVTRAFRYVSGLGMTSLGALTASGSSQGTGIDSSGSVIVGFTDVSNGNRHAFRWTLGGTMADLGALPGDSFSSAGAVSADGTTVVGTSTFPFSPSYRAFRWTNATGMVALPGLPGGGNPSPTGADRTGSGIIGYASVPGASHAILWSPRVGASPVDLNSYLPALGEDLTGWTLTYGWAISADGSTLVGEGWHNGHTEAWVATLPRCGSADFNCDGDVGTDADIEAFFACIVGNCPAPPCPNTADFNGDGDTGTDADIEAFFRVLAGGSC